MSVYATNARINMSPQQFLDDLHRLDVPRLYEPTLTPQQRQNLLVMTRNELTDWRQTLREQMMSISRRYSPQEKNEAQIALAPFRLLDGLGKELAQSIAQLEKCLKTNQPIPEGFMFGTLIFGTPDLGDWHLGTPQDAGRYDDMMAIRQRLENLIAERTPMQRELAQTTGRIKAQQQRLKDDVAVYKKRTSALRITLRAVLIAAFVGVLIAILQLFYTSETAVLGFLTNDTAALLMVVVIVVFIMGMILDRRRRHSHVEQLKQDIKSGKRRLEQLKFRHKKTRQHYYPLNELVNQLQKEYNDLRATF